MDAKITNTKVPKLKVHNFSLWSHFMSNKKQNSKAVIEMI